MNLIMLNMLLAIIMDVYTEVKGGIGSDAETLGSQAGPWHRKEPHWGHAAENACNANLNKTHISLFGYSLTD